MIHVIKPSKLKMAIFVFAIFSSCFSTVFSKPIDKNGLIYFYGYPFNSEQEIKQISETPSILKGEISIEWKDVYTADNEYDWAYIDKNIEVWKRAGKKVILRFMTANNATYCTSEKLIDQQRIRLVSEGYFTDFEGSLGNDGYESVDGEVTYMNLSKAGEKALVLNETINTNKIHIQTLPKLNFVPNAAYLVQFDFKILKLIHPKRNGFFKITFQSRSNPLKKVEELFYVCEGEKSLFTKQIKLKDAADYQMLISSENLESAIVDNLNIIQSSDSSGKRVAFPDYFSASFKTSYTKFMTAMARRYRNNTTVDAIKIGGVGRWEEMLLNANEEGIHDVQESIYRQWKNYGYTDVSYLKDVVEWSIDLSKKLLPNKEHILQISPMNNGYRNEDFIYRRAASMAVAKAVSIKQNGMSEKYETWSGTSDPAYIMNRYRDEPTIKRYYETAGQICRNTLNAMGHPLSLFNRVAIDGANFLYLYKADILEPNVQHYFPYFDSIIQHPIINLLYSKLGEYPLLNRRKRQPTISDTIIYHNNWLGLRQYVEAGANVDYVVDTQCNKKGVKTNGENSRILFDVDDRMKYNGMSNPILTIEYKDNGTDVFNVQVKNCTTGMLENIASVQKTNTGTMKLKSIPIGHRFDSFDNQHEAKPEIVIDDNRDGVEFISSVELSFVPIYALKMKVISEMKAIKHPLFLTSESDKIEREIRINQQKPIAKAEILYSDSDFSKKTNIYASLRLINEKMETEQATKQYYIGGNNEAIRLPIASKLIAQKAILSLFDGTGKVGGFKAADGKIAYRLYQFENKKNMDFKTENQYIIIKSFFNGFEFSPNIEFKNLVIKKILADGSEQNIDYSISEKTLYFEPQNAGKYLIKLKDTFIQPISIYGLIVK